MIDKTLYEDACFLAQYRGYDHHDDYKMVIESIYHDLKLRKEQLEKSHEDIYQR